MLFKIQVLWFIVDIYLWSFESHSCWICKIKFIHYWYFVLVIDSYCLLVDFQGLPHMESCMYSWIFPVVTWFHFGRWSYWHFNTEQKHSWKQMNMYTANENCEHTDSITQFHSLIKFLVKSIFIFFPLRHGGPLACAGFQRTLTIFIFIFLLFQSFYL